MFKYQVKFARQRQIDGWTNPVQDLEYDTVKETVIVVARNKEHAKHVACKTAYGWITKIYPRLIKWSKEDIKSIKRK